MRNRAFHIALLAAISLFFISGCGLFTKKSRRVITETHWGSSTQPVVAERTPAPEADPKPEADDADAEEADGESADAEGTADADTQDTEENTVATASTGNIGTTSSSDDGAKKMTLYIAYQEAISMQNNINGDESDALMKSRVRMCQLHDDNSLECTESEELNDMLNPHLKKD